MDELSPELQAIFSSGEVLHPAAADINPLFQRHVAGYRFCEPYCRDRVVLDVGTGEGYGAHFLAQTARQLFGLEYAAVLAGHARSRYRRPNLAFARGQAEHLPFPNETFETVVSLQLIEHLPHYRSFLEEARRVLRPGGVLVTVTPNRRTMLSGVNPYHYTEFDPAELGRAMRPYFAETEVFGLFGSERYLALKQAEQGLARQILALDFLRLRRFLPRWLLAWPYRWAFGLVNRSTSDRERTAGLQITPEDFTIGLENLEQALEAITVCRKG
jgi:ubiquinone/menaquinone biosynthesis C-methylase UbiE